MELSSLPARRLHGTVRVPGDKSIAHRVLMLSAVADGTSRVRWLPDGEDMRSSARVLTALGVQIEAQGQDCVVSGRGLHGLQEPSGALDCGNSGTTMRLMAGLLAGQGFASVLTGDASLRSRPMARIAEPLRAMGASVETAPESLPPLRIRGGEIRPVAYEPPVASAQVKSCVLLAGLYADGETSVIEPVPTRDHTERLLRQMGAVLTVEGTGPTRIRLIAPAALEPLSGVVPGDLSSAAYWLAAASIVPGSELLLPAVGINPTRSAVVELLSTWGARIEIEDRRTELGEPVATLRVRSSGEALRGGVIGPAQVPGLIDELPLLAALGPFTVEGVEIRGAAELRVKESDRIAATCAALRAIGASVQEYPDGLAVAGGTKLHGGVIEARGDHRIAMTFGVVGLATESGVTIRGAEAAAVSYPGFFSEIDRLASR